MPEARFYKDFWTPVFTGVTAFENAKYLCEEVPAKSSAGIGDAQALWASGGGTNFDA